MERLLTNGSVVELDVGKRMIIGARMIERDGELHLAYLGVPFPIGYIEKKNISEFFDDVINTVLYEFPLSNDIYKGWHESYARLVSSLEGKSKEEAEGLLNDVVG